jgi:hypothetical protein
LPPSSGLGGTRRRSDPALAAPPMPASGSCSDDSAVSARANRVSVPRESIDVDTQRGRNRRGRF